MQIKPSSSTDEALLEKFFTIPLDDRLAIRHLNLIKYEIDSHDRLQFIHTSLSWSIAQIYKKWSTSTPGNPISIPPETAIEIDCADILTFKYTPFGILSRIKQIRDKAIPCFKGSLAKHTPEECEKLTSQLASLLRTQLKTIYQMPLMHSSESDFNLYLEHLSQLISDINDSIK